MSDAPAEERAPKAEMAQIPATTVDNEAQNTEDVPSTATEDNVPQEKKDAAEFGEFDVFWNEPADQDPENPMSWSMGRKWGIIATISFITFLT